MNTDLSIFAEPEAPQKHSEVQKRVILERERQSGRWRCMALLCFLVAASAVSLISVEVFVTKLGKEEVYRLCWGWLLLLAVDWVLAELLIACLVSLVVDRALQMNIGSGWVNAAIGIQKYRLVRNFTNLI